MNKKIIIWVGMIFLIGIVVGAGIGNVVLSNYDVPSITPENRMNGTITFLADGIAGSCYLDEPEGAEISDDFEACLRNNYAGKTITSAKDWLNRDWKQVEVNGIIHRSFNQTELDNLVNQNTPTEFNAETDYHCEATGEIKTCDCISADKRDCYIKLAKHSCSSGWIKIRGDPTMC